MVLERMARFHWEGSAVQCGGWVSSIFFKWWCGRAAKAGYKLRGVTVACEGRTHNYAVLIDGFTQFGAWGEVGWGAVVAGA